MQGNGFFYEFSNEPFRWVHPSEHSVVKKSKIAAIVVGSLLLIGGFLAGGIIGFANSHTVSEVQNFSANTLMLASPELIAYISHLEPALLGIDVKKDNHWFDGTGIAMRHRGVVLTSYYLLQNAQEINVHDLFGHIWSGKLIGYDEETNLALLKVPTSFDRVAAVASASENEAGQLAIGICLSSPNSKLNVYLTKIDQANVRLLTGGNNKVLAVDKTDEVNSPCGDSAILVDSAGKVLGIKIFQSGFQNVDFYESCTLIPYVVNSILTGADSYHAWLGIEGQSIEPGTDIETQPVSTPVLSTLPAGVTGGVYVQYVYSKSPAEVSGILPGDVIVGINGQPVSDMDDLQSMLYKFRPGTRIDLQILRKGNYINIAVDLGQNG